MNNTQETGRAITSTGNVNSTEARQDDRAYRTDSTIHTTLVEFQQSWRSFMREVVQLRNNEQTPARRVVLRTFIATEMFEQFENWLETTNTWARDQGGWQIGFELDLPLNQRLEVSENPATTTSHLVTLAVNFHPTNDLSAAEEIRLWNFRRKPQWWHSVATRLASVRDNWQSSFTSQVTEDDIPALVELWSNNFGWDEAGIRRVFLENNTAWFCGVRNSEGTLVAASMAEAITIGDQLYVELTEWAARAGKVASGMIMLLICQVLADTVYTPSNESRRLPIIVAEQNLHHPEPHHLGAPAVGVSAGLRPATSDRERMILYHNVTINAGREPHYLVGEEPSEWGHINHFVYGVLLPEMIRQGYSADTVLYALERYLPERSTHVSSIQS